MAFSVIVFCTISYQEGKAVKANLRAIASNNKLFRSSLPRKNPVLSLQERLWNIAPEGYRRVKKQVD
jgi:hypothetical protein